MHNVFAPFSTVAVVVTPFIEAHPDAVILNDVYDWQLVLTLSFVEGFLLRYEYNVVVVRYLSSTSSRMVSASIEVISSVFSK